MEINQDLINEALKHIKENVPVYGEQFSSPDCAKTFCTLSLSNKKREHFLVLFLNAQNKIIKDEVLFKGTVNSASVHPRVVAQKALEYNAVSVILSHNHPSGLNKPSPSDIGITTRIKEALGLFDIKVLDHIIVADDPYSFAENGML